MKRLIKFWNQFESDSGQKFSDCSTKYEILPALVADDAGIPELKSLAKRFGIKLGRKIFEAKLGRLTHTINTTEIKTRESFGKTEKLTVYLGFITLDTRGYLDPIESVGNHMTLEQADQIVNNQAYGVSDVGQNINDDTVLVKTGWNYYHEMDLLGYSHKQFEELLGVTEEGFYDDTFRCGQCGAFDRNDNGYTNNFRMIDCELIGMRCGCYDDFCKGDGGLEHFADNPNECMEASAAKSLVRKKKIKLVESFVGGMTDPWRSHSLKGKTVRVCSPTDALNEYKKKNPKAKYVFVHEESGQFQTYFSLYKVI